MSNKKSIETFIKHSTSYLLRMFRTILPIAAVATALYHAQIELIIIIIGFSFLIAVARALGVIDDSKDTPAISTPDGDSQIGSLEPLPKFKLDDDLKLKIVEHLKAESKGAIAEFVETEIFKNAAKQRDESNKFKEIFDEFKSNISEYQSHMAQWKINANVNLFFGLVCALAGIALMYFLVSGAPMPGADPNNLGNEFFKFISKFGLVIIFESVAFFFLKVYREDRAILRYFRNEVTNLELKAIALRTALAVGSATDRSKIVNILCSTERNFTIKKDERVITDITQENSEMLLEKFLGLVGKYSPPTAPSRETNHRPHEASANGKEAATP
jgi:hypothetical protein